MEKWKEAVHDNLISALVHAGVTVWHACSHITRSIQSVLFVYPKHPQHCCVYGITLVSPAILSTRFPPQDNPCFTQQAGKARWTLSEAEDERGAGLWVWGLFKDPLYPFLLLQMDNLGIVSPISSSYLTSNGEQPAGRLQFFFTVGKIIGYPELVILPHRELCARALHVCFPPVFFVAPSDISLKKVEAIPYHVRD